MSVKYHKRNTNFQVEYFLEGSQHTPDGKYFMLLELLEDRNAAMNNFNVQKLKMEARRMKAQATLDTANAAQWEKKMAEAELLEISNTEKTEEPLVKACEDEINFIKGRIEEIKKDCQYLELPPIEAHEKVQAEEWLLELKDRATNFLLCHGVIPAEELRTMRLHPAFKEKILPHIKTTETLIVQQKQHLLLE